MLKMKPSLCSETDAFTENTHDAAGGQRSAMSEEGVGWHREETEGQIQIQEASTARCYSSWPWPVVLLKLCVCVCVCVHVCLNASVFMYCVRV